MMVCGSCEIEYLKGNKMVRNNDIEWPKKSSNYRTDV